VLPGIPELLSLRPPRVDAANCGEEQSYTIVPAPRSKNSQKGINAMLHYAVIFLIIAIIAGIFGFTGIAGTSAWIAHVLFVLFLVLFVISLLFRGRPSV
jgi:uncharacterized membrane protein YtjA (UPF0391 family)